MQPRKIVILTLRMIVAGVFLQTLFFKFTGAAESIFIFETVGLEPAGRYATGFAELIASVLLLWPSQYRRGAMLSILIIVPAILLHLTVLGIVVHDDGGLLFALACSVLAGSATLLILGRKTEQGGIS